LKKRAKRNTPSRVCPYTGRSDQQQGEHPGRSHVRLTPRFSRARVSERRLQALVRALRTHRQPPSESCCLCRVHLGTQSSA
jgi:hypothetical protein